MSEWCGASAKGLGQGCLIGQGLAGYATSQGHANGLDRRCAHLGWSWGSAGVVEEMQQVFMVVVVAEARRKQQLPQRLHAAPATISPCLAHREQESKLASKQGASKHGLGRVCGVVWC